MNLPRLVLLLSATYLAVFVQSGFNGPRLWLGSTLSLVPGLLVFAAMRLDLTAVTCLALAGGLWLDALSANPLGASVLPLFLVGWLLWRQREHLLLELDYAQLVLGAAASLLVPVLTLVVVLSKGFQPDLGWRTLWQLAVLAVSGGIFTPLVFRGLDWLERRFMHPAAPPGTYPGVREIKRGRH